MKKMVAMVGVVMLMVFTGMCAVDVTVDLTDRQQTMEGFGGFGPGKNWWSKAPFFSNAYINTMIDDLGFTMIRENAFCNIECTNDNSDPNNLDLAAMEAQIDDLCRGSGTSDGGSGMYGSDITDVEFGKQMVYWKALKTKADASDEPLRLIASIWSPPPWMKKCNCIKGDGAGSPNITDTKVTLKPGVTYLQELGEYMAGWALLMQKKVGMLPYAMSLQNEPVFKEPYGSCVYNGPLYAQALKEVRKRLDAEDLQAVKLYGNEDVTETVSRIVSWCRDIAAVPEALSALHVLATHNYASNAITPTSPDVNRWKGLGNIAQVLLQGKNHWMTESGMGGISAEKGFAAARGIYLGIKYGRITAWTWWYLIENVLSNSGSIYDSGYFYKQFTRFIRPGAVHVGATTTDDKVGAIAFEHAFNNCYTVLLVNDESGSKEIKISGAGLPASFSIFQSSTSTSDRCASKGTYTTGNTLTIPGKSVVTLVSGKYQGTKEGAVASDRPVPVRRASMVPAVRRGTLFTLNGKVVARNIDADKLRQGATMGIRPGCYLLRGKSGTTMMQVK